MQNEMQTANGHMGNDLVIFGENGVPVTTSLKVAESFGKQHKHVLDAVNKLECSEKFRQPNFRPANYLDRQGKTRGQYEITRDGFTFLAMGFTGKKAAKFKERYIEAFNAMEKELIKDQAPIQTGITTETLTNMFKDLLDHQEKRFWQTIHIIKDSLKAPQETTGLPPNQDTQDTEDLSEIMKGLGPHQDYFGPIASKREKRKIKKEAQQVQSEPMKATYYTTRSQIDFIMEHFARMKCGRLPLPLVGKNLKLLSEKMKLPPNAVGEQGEHIGAYHEDVIARFKERVERGHGSLLTHNLGSYLKPVTLSKVI